MKILKTMKIPFDGPAVSNPSFERTSRIKPREAAQFKRRDDRF
jgi:hypothetical protein